MTNAFGSMARRSSRSLGGSATRFIFNDSNDDTVDGSNNYIFNTASPHGLTPTSVIHLRKMADMTYQGDCTVATVPSATSFTLVGITFSMVGTGEFVIVVVA